MSNEQSTGNRFRADVRLASDGADGSPRGGDQAKVAVSYVRVSTKEQAERDGDPDGYSLPAQLEANRRKAEAKGAMVIEEFVERGESAKFADTRPELQRMLAYLKVHQVDYVIVHKVDRLARNRLDDAQIHMVIKRSGAELVSATENIDETPSGMLLHGIMSSIAEFYSQNLANEVVKGMEQKAKTGGTPGRAPLGYRNVRAVTDDGREVRTVEVDPDRAPLITWAFEAYASGDWTLSRMAAELERRGLTTRPTPRSPGVPIKYNSLHKILTTPYYKGEVTYRGARYAGRHQPIVDESTWSRVQDVLSSHAMGEKQRAHPHYLKSSVFCGKCGSRLIVTMSKNSAGTVYPYFICLGRHQKAKDCTQRAVLISVVEDRVEEHYRTIQLDADSRSRIEAVLTDELQQYRRGAETTLQQLATQKARLTDERMSLLHAHYAGAIPLDLLKTEQTRIARQLTGIEERLSAASMEFDSIEKAFRAALDFAVNCYMGYLRARGPERRIYNQAFFSRILVDEGDISVDVAEPFSTLFATAPTANYQGEGAKTADEAPRLSLTDAIRVENNKPAERVAGLKMTSMVRWEGGHSWFAECVARIRPEYVPVDPCDRLVHLPGQQVQCDLWMPGAVVPDHRGVLRSFPVLVMVAAHARFIAAMMIQSKVTWDLLAGMWQLIFEHIGGVPRTLLWDNEAGIGQRGRLAQGVAGFCGVLGTRLIQARPYDPETKGVAERANQYLETSFLPGRVFVSAADFNAQLWQWLSTRANQRRHAGTREVPAQALVADRAAMAVLPPVAPAVGTTVITRLGRDYYVNTGGNAYSVHPEMIGRMVTVHTGLDQITAHCGGLLVADHQRLWGTAGLVSDPAHVAAAAVLREQYRPRPTAGRHLEVDVEVADLSAYDAVFGTGEVA